MAVPRFWREANQRYNLKGSKCDNCGTTHMPARTLCPNCRHASVGKIHPYEFKGTGTVESWTVVHSAPAGFELQAPYALAIVRLDEGPQVLGQVVDVAADALAIGMRVSKVFRRINQDGDAGVVHYGFKFVPERSEGAT